MSTEHVEKFCGVCKHPYPGHYASCPIVTQMAQRGVFGANPQDMQPVPQGTAQSGYGQFGQAQPGNVSDTDWAILTRLKEITLLLAEIREIARAILEKQP